MEKSPPSNPPSLTLIGRKSQTDESDEQMDEKTSDLLTTKVCSVVSETLERLLTPVNISSVFTETLERLLAPAEICSTFTETFERLLAPAAELESIKRKALLTETEVAQLFSASAITLRSNRCKGAGPRYIKDGSKILYPMVDLVSYYNGRLIRTKDSL